LQVDTVEVDGLDSDIVYERAISTPSRIVERSPTHTSQQAAVSELRILSQPSTVPSISKLRDYVYDDKAGEGIYIYMLDDGINTDADVSKINAHLAFNTVYRAVYSKRAVIGPQGRRSARANPRRTQQSA